MGIFIGFLALIAFGYAAGKWQDQKIAQSPFFSMLSITDLALQHAQDCNDWKGVQMGSLQKIWLDQIRDSKIHPFPGAKIYANKEEEKAALAKLLYESVKVPENLVKSDYDHLQLASRVCQDYSHTVGYNKYSACLYKPESILPYPKDYIEKSLQYVINHIEMSDDAEFITFMKDLELSLFGLRYFVPVEEAALPITPWENAKYVSDIGLMVA